MDTARFAFLPFPVFSFLFLATSRFFFVGDPRYANGRAPVDL